MKYQERASESRDTVKAERVLVEQPLSDRLLLNYGNSENQSFYGLSCSEISAAASSSEQKLQLDSDEGRRGGWREGKVEDWSAAAVPDTDGQDERGTLAQLRPCSAEYYKTRNQ
ncbi:unnamed protein product [Pleuronectes platessa]|uniref:Uncharacterized protein n=1 Tax=Pleuronectes platessa TaxID=8262 RepID=A0A9N7UHL1_PLEPL|nr:unnamed protein product [Pleuronectes platessa]